MISWVKALLPKVPGPVWILLLAVLCWGVIVGMAVLMINATNAIRDAGFKAGETHEQAKVQDQVIQNVEQANDVREQINSEAARGSGSLLYRQCLRSARSPENCQRYLPGR